ncbi:methylenetetrahydrofolate reductase [NAD(P)H] [Acutalibacter sp. LFL-21]|uniref:methylenetetrahydrofolate reductase [NAD(P)H] n=1 Tax=Acutalibacter sp. LFL-21 TaxID=2983399 RepID=UPI0021D662F9|nr:methylenetetrahydrofolate reductase [NAD(P)H] [Acutalibacter sp. LFL-21]MCU7653103.1 methylenetetrahydrofolate reductase [NAD(P)H] [Acutalibacter sp. LFL-21]
MKIKNLFGQKKVTISCEIFPPKKDTAFSGIFETVDAIQSLGVDFISVTYGAGGSTSKKTVEVASYIQERHHLPALAHLTCCDSTKEDIRQRLAEMKERGIENILALRGDKPKEYVPGPYTYAIDLIRDIKSQGDFCIGGACYPDGHVECEHKEDDIAFLKEKVEAGCDFLTTQMFFDNNVYYNFLYRVLAVGIQVPVIPGIMPVINARQVKRSAELSGTSLPPRFKAIADKFSDDPLAMEQAGIAYATEQIIDLVANGVKYIHLYTMNRPQTAAKIMENLSHILR